MIPCLYFDSRKFNIFNVMVCLFLMYYALVDFHMSLPEVAPDPEITPQTDLESVPFQPNSAPPKMLAGPL